MCDPIVMPLFSCPLSYQLLHFMMYQQCRKQYGNLKGYYNQYPIRYGCPKQGTNSIKVKYEKGSDGVVDSMMGPNSRGETTPGYWSFSRCNHERSMFAFCLNRANGKNLEYVPRFWLFGQHFLLAARGCHRRATLFGATIYMCSNAGRMPLEVGGPPSYRCHRLYGVTPLKAFLYRLLIRPRTRNLRRQRLLRVGLALCSYQLRQWLASKSSGLFFNLLLLVQVEGHLGGPGREEAMAYF
jgi:hypothetical protein